MYHLQSILITLLLLKSTSDSSWLTTKPKMTIPSQSLKIKTSLGSTITKGIRFWLITHPLPVKRPNSISLKNYYKVPLQNAKFQNFLTKYWMRRLCKMIFTSTLSIGAIKTSLQWVCHQMFTFGMETTQKWLNCVIWGFQIQWHL